MYLGREAFSAVTETVGHPVTHTSNVALDHMSDLGGSAFFLFGFSILGFFLEVTLIYSEVNKSYIYILMFWLGLQLLLWKFY